jgi:hypothetical protein
MDETPEELAQIKKEAEAIDLHKYRRRYRVLMTLVAIGFCSAVTWVAVTMAVAGRNPCERVRDHFCRKDAKGIDCNNYQLIFKDSVEEESPKMRGNIREQCLTKINRLRDEDGIVVE